MEETPGSYEGDAGWVLSTRSRQGSDKRSGKKAAAQPGLAMNASRLKL
jgi:hypothetical protein